MFNIKTVLYLWQVFALADFFLCPLSLFFYKLTLILFSKLPVLIHQTGNLAYFYLISRYIPSYRSILCFYRGGAPKGFGRGVLRPDVSADGPSNGGFGAKTNGFGGGRGGFGSGDSAGSEAKSNGFGSGRFNRVDILIQNVSEQLLEIKYSPWAFLDFCVDALLHYQTILLTFFSCHLLICIIKF